MPDKSLFAAIVGKPNVGKSTLLNRMLGVRLAIISPKPQTTRNRILGVVTNGEDQFVFIDTPGFHAPRNRLDAHMVKAVRDSAADVDCALFMTWPKTDFDAEEQSLLDELFQRKLPVVLVVNKSDTVEAPAGETACAALAVLRPFAGSALISALNGDGVDALTKTLSALACEGPHMFPDDTLTDIPEKVVVAELIRERLLCDLSQELPHGCAVNVVRFKERENRALIDIDAEIVCEKDSHKGMIIGKGGAMLKKIGSEARASIESFLDCRVNLQLWVKVREGWRDKENFIRDFGY
ncbi:MAG: GTPase Era [Oscillospiraceae bacterium]|nr:GTPase Era [Oscillospiraceae bacterium]